MTKTGIIILAAGNSSRLGRPKQLLPFQGKTLLSHVVTESGTAFLHPIVVVTGACHAAILDSLDGLAACIVYNPQWETGMASGIVSGLDRAVSLQPQLQQVIVAVCDQPYISAELFRLMMEEYSISGKGLIACRYSGTAGTPVLFDRRYFKELTMLSGDAGAKQMLRRYHDDVATVSFPKGDVDIDTAEDLIKMI